MAKTIDPAFQAAPFLGDSSHDPVAFARSQKMMKNQAQMRKARETDENTAKGLEKLMLDIKGWEDEKGFSEVMSSYNKNINAFMDMSKKGLDLTSPKTEADIMAFNRLQQEHAKTKQLLDTWDRNKKAVDLFDTMIKQDAAKPESERKLDYESSRLNLEKQLSGNIQDRNLNLESLLVFKPEIGDVHKYVSGNMQFITKPDNITTYETDPDTGQSISRTREVITPEVAKAQEQDYRKLYNTADKAIKTTVKMQRENDPNPSLNIMSDEDYFVAMYNLKFKEKMIDKAAGGSGGGFNINFLGSRSPISAGRIRPEALVYGDVSMPNTYIFEATTKPLEVPLGEKTMQFIFNKWSPPFVKGGTVEATLYAYDPASDSFIFNTTSTSNSTAVKNNTAIRVPRSEIGDQADELRVEVDGEIKKLKDLYGAMQATKKKLPVTWSQGVYTGSKKPK